ncbi:TonB-dependent receptor plug domain-containing protein [Thiovibrio frasassiensis]|uniref:TonB-dependent receptor n=1 Tax=Thiovibrio frasassiensis TaxID=2984131 RepID=A0A9X4RPT7_9BACT|nr:TonB-dependent receptor [Thiovibrio frasassiensis]MDG4475537.1 TonB-dependent receptor [Thiovibrio frasassiensis]
MAAFRSAKKRKPSLSRKATTLTAISILMASSQPCWAAHPKITALSLEELLSVDITSVSKKTEKASDAAAAVFVVSQEDIKRSGATSIPEVLRMVPGLQVARIDANKWAVSSRGFNAFSSNKLLVLMDGRTLYNPLFSGVLWNAQDTMLDDIERIEVIRGPGASLWGANAVNGVINIITKHSADTQGGLLTAGTGSEEKGFGSVRYGTKINEHTTYRVYGKNFYRDDLEFANGSEANDDWHQARGGFRLDSAAPDSPYSYTIQGDGYNGYADAATNIPTLIPPFTTDISNPSHIRGGNLLGRLTRKGPNNSEMSLQGYYDLAKSNDRLLGDDRGTGDIEFQHRFQATERQELTWGLGYRYSHDTLENSATFSFAPASRTDQLLSAFVQDEITLIDDLLRLTLGSKFEHNDFTGYEAQPNARLLYTPHKHHTFWGAVSQAVRTPSQAEHDIRISSAIVPSTYIPQLSLFPAGLAEFVINGNEEYKSEKLTAYEIGYRTQVHEKLAFDLTAFLNDYSRLRTTPPFPAANFITANSTPGILYQLNYEAGNTMEGQTYGFELVADAKPLEWWRLQLAYTFLRLDLQETGQGLYASEDAEGESPRNQVSLRSMMDLGSRLTLDTWLRYVDNLPTYGIASYVTLDARIGWQLNPQVELSLVGQNLLDNAQPEFGSLFINTIPSEIERSVYAQVRMTF